MRRRPNDSSGFTLIELSIVLVIIGLVIAGVLVGQNLVRNAQLRKYISDVSKYKSAVNTFRGKYGCLPGDCANATSYWGSAGCTSPETDTVAGNPLATCNGNGDDIIGMPASSKNVEFFRFWQHLSNAGLIEGQYSGVGGAIGNVGSLRIPTFGVNIPDARDGVNGYSLIYWTMGQMCSAPGDWASGDINSSETYLLIGALRPGSYNWQPSFTTSDAGSIDRKMDDGLPGTGMVRAKCATYCTSGNDTASATYRNDNNVQCNVQVKIM